MPRIQPELIDVSFYLYPSRESAKEGGQAGGTGLLIQVELPSNPGSAVVYAVSNAHVVHADGCSVIRLNKRDGSTDIIDLDPAEWFALPGDDLAICLIPLDQTAHKVRTIGEHWFVTEEDVKNGIVGNGDDVFMVGRFVNHDGHLTNVPSVRFGHISMMPLPIRHPAGYNQLSFAVEMLSRPGYSGSPVYVYRNPYDLATGNMSIGGRTTKFLGVNWGFVLDRADVQEKEVPIGVSGAPETRKINYVPVNTGMNGVVPAWHLKKLLDAPTIKARRDQLDKQLAGTPMTIGGGFGGYTELASAQPARDNNPNHREDFTSLLNAAARKQQPDD